MTNRSVKLSEFVPLAEKDDQVLCRYMELEYFILMLKTGKLYAKRKRFYNDSFEKCPPMDAAYRLAPSGDNTSPQPGLEERRKSIDNKYAEWAAMPTSCWTLDTKNNYLMWKAYAPHLGIRITSSINRFISSIMDGIDFQRNKCTIHLGQMDYGGLCKEEQTGFWKEHSYRDEKEYRFYFEIEGDSCNARECSGIKGIHIPMNMATLIESITISPFINHITAQEIERFLKCRFDIKKVTPIKLR